MNNRNRFFSYLMILVHLFSTPSYAVSFRNVGKNFKAYQSKRGSLVVTKLGDQRIVIFKNSLGSVRETYDSKGVSTLYNFVRYPYNYLVNIQKTTNGAKRFGVLARPLNVSFESASDKDVECLQTNAIKFYDDSKLPKFLSADPNFDVSCKEGRSKILKAMDDLQSEDGYLMRCLSSPEFGKNEFLRNPKTMGLLASVLLKLNNLRTSNSKINISCEKLNEGSKKKALYIPATDFGHEQIKIDSRLVDDSSASSPLEIQETLSHEIMHSALQSIAGEDDEKFVNEVWDQCYQVCREEGKANGVDSLFAEFDGKKSEARFWHCLDTADQKVGVQSLSPTPTPSPSPNADQVPPQITNVEIHPSFVPPPAPPPPPPPERIAAPEIPPAPVFVDPSAEQAEENNKSSAKASSSVTVAEPVAQPVAQTLMDERNSQLSESIRNNPAVTKIEPIGTSLADRLFEGAKAAVVDPIANEYADHMNTIAGAMNQAIASTRDVDYSSVSKYQPQFNPKASQIIGGREILADNFPTAPVSQLYANPLPTIPKNIDAKDDKSNLKALPPIVADSNLAAESASIAGAKSGSTLDSGAAISSVNSIGAKVLGAAGGSGGKQGLLNPEADKSGEANAQATTSEAIRGLASVSNSNGRFQKEQDYISTLTTLTSLGVLQGKEYGNIRDKIRDPLFVKMLADSKVAIILLKPVKKIIGDPSKAEYIFSDEEAGKLKRISKQSAAVK